MGITDQQRTSRPDPAVTDMRPTGERGRAEQGGGGEVVDVRAGAVPAVTGDRARQASPTPATGSRPRVFLVGLMGSGKSTVGRLLADRLGWPYQDNDTLLQQRTGFDAPTLAELGRAALHAQESRQLRSLLDAPPPFIAGVAASVADYQDDLALMAAAGPVIYLRAAPVTLAQRVGRGRGRPWLGDDPLAMLERMFAVRDLSYRGVADVVDTDGRNPREIAADLALRFTPGPPREQGTAG